jgi:hypothetical protein
LAGSGTLKKEVRYLKPSPRISKNGPRRMIPVSIVPIIWEQNPIIALLLELGPPALFNKRRWSKEEDPW